MCKSLNFFYICMFELNCLLFLLGELTVYLTGLIKGLALGFSFKFYFSILLLFSKH